MRKKISTLMFMGICGALLTTTMLTAAEADTQKEHIQVGLRAEPLEVRAAQAQARDKKAEKAQKAQNSLKSMTSIHHTSHPGAYHNAVGINAYGHIEMEDGSIWTVHPGDAYITLSWLPTDLIVVTPNHSWFSPYQFKITNQNTAQAVLTNMQLGPIYNGLYTKWIVGIDYYYNVVYLNDGSAWNMSSLDSGTIGKWLVNDTVVIGVNDGFLASMNPNILINVNMLNFAAGVAGY